MIKQNTDSSAPLQFILKDKTVIGQFYNSWDKLYHLAIYIPYYLPPHKYLCKKTGNFSSSRDEKNINKCIQCWSILRLWKSNNEKDNETQ